MSDRIEKRIELRTPTSRVWRALTDSGEFGAWFGVTLDEPFEAGRASTGRISSPGNEPVTLTFVVQDMEPERLFSFTWHPHAMDREIDYSQEPQTLVEFRLEPTAAGTLLLLTESGFDALLPARREPAFRGNDGGWTAQLKNIESHLAQDQ